MSSTFKPTDIIMIFMPSEAIQTWYWFSTTTRQIFVTWQWYYQHARVMKWHIETSSKNMTKFLECGTKALWLNKKNPGFIHMIRIMTTVGSDLMMIHKEAQYANIWAKLYLIAELWSYCQLNINIIAQQSRTKVYSWKHGSRVLPTSSSLTEKPIL